MTVQIFSTISEYLKTFMFCLTHADDLGRIVIPKEIRRVLRIREGDPSLTTLEPWQRFSAALLSLGRRCGWEQLT